jgi:phosphatidylglycerol---prolipoprotein diacylglyceryl transferase
MRPILFRCFGRRVPSYRTLLTLALIVFGEAMVIQAGQRGIALPPTLAMCTLLIAAALAGARLFYVISEWSKLRRDGRRIWVRGDTGASLFGGVVAVHLFTLPCTAVAGLRTGEILDMLAIATLVALPIGRIGCLLHGCCAGRTWVWLPPAAEMVVAIALLPGVVVLAHARTGAGFLAGMTAYAVFRFAMDFVRRDAAARGWTAAQRMALLVATIDAGALALLL